MVLSQSAELGNVLSAGDTAFAFVENERLVDQIEELKTLELPFFFKHADYQFTAPQLRAHQGAAGPADRRGLPDAGADGDSLRL